MASAPHVREEILEPLRRVLRWMASLRDARGRIICPEHKVEHSGKNAGAIVIACELARLDPAADKAWLSALALEQSRRLCELLVREGTSACHTFRPGRHDPFNCSNSVIDGGRAEAQHERLLGRARCGRRGQRHFLGREHADRRGTQRTQRKERLHRRAA